MFKLGFSIRGLDTIRSVNLIPFYYENEIGGNFHLKEVLENVAIFVPFGIYLGMLKYGKDFKIRCVILFLASLILEVLQYVLAVGKTDITDVITNTCGGILGIFIYWMVVKIFRDEKRVNTAFTVLAAIVTVVVAGGLSVLLLLNR